MVKNIISAFFSRGVVALSNFAILLLSTRYLGSTVFGQISLLILNVAIIQTINEIYTGSAIVYFVPGKSLSHIYKQGLLFILGGTILLNFGLLAFDKIETAFLFHLPLLTIIISLNAFNNVLLLAYEKIKAYNFQIFIQPALMLLFLAVQLFMLNNQTLNAYLISLYLSFGISLCISLISVVALFKTIKTKESVSFSKVISNGFINQLGNLAHTLSNRLNYYLLGSQALVGVYASSTSLIESVFIISGSISPIILSHVANKKEATGNAHLSLTLAKISFMLSSLCVIIIVLLPASFFTFLLGKNFQDTKTIMLYLSPGVLCISFSAILSHYFSGLGKQKILLLANFLGLLITLCTAWPLINYFGLIGACYSGSLAYIVQAVVLTVVFFKTTEVKITELFTLVKNFKLE